VATDKSFLPFPSSILAPEGFELQGFSHFCSARLVEPGEPFGFVNRIFLTGEETGGDFDSISGNMWALDVENGDFYAVPAVGCGAWYVYQL